MKTLQIRSRSAKDVHAFCELRLEALERELKSFIESPAEFPATSLETAAVRLEPSLDGGTFVLGAFDGDRLVGMAGVVRVGAAEDEAQGQYIGCLCRGKPSRQRNHRCSLNWCGGFNRRPM